MVTVIRSGRFWKWVGFGLVAGLAGLLVIFKALAPSASLESPVLLALLNTLFLCAIPLGMAFWAARSYQATGAFAFLLAGSGLVAFGVASLYAGWVMPLAAGGTNPTVTVHNLGALVAGACQFGGAHHFLQELIGAHQRRRRRWSPVALYAGLAALVSVIAGLAFWGKLPVFFDAATGPSSLRQLVLGGAIGFFVLAGLLFAELASMAQTDFAYWYSLGLWLIAIGLAAVWLQPSVGSVLGWAGRAAQYLGSVYVIVAFVRGRQEPPTAGLSASGQARWGLWPYLEQKVLEQAAALTQTQADLERETAERTRAEQQLRESEKRYREMVQFAPAGIYEVDFRTRRFTSVNDVMCELTGYTREELLAMGPFDILDAESQARFRARLQKWLNGEAPEPNVEYRVLAKDGHEIWTLLNVTFTHDAQGAPLGATVVGQDVTERVRIEQARQQAEAAREQLLAEVERRAAELNAILDAAPVGLTVVDADGRVVRLNTAGERMLGVRTADMAGTVAGRVSQFSPLKADGTPYQPEETPTYQALHGQTVLDALQVVRRASGRQYLNVNAAPVRTAAGQPAGAVTSYTDVTDRYRQEETIQWQNEQLQAQNEELTAQREELQAQNEELRAQQEELAANEAALRESEARLRAVLDTSPDPIFLKDRAGRLVLANPATFAAIGKPAEAVLGKTDAEFYDDPATGRVISATDQRIMASGQSEVVEESVTRGAGTRFYLSTKAPFRDAEGNVIGLLGVARDITERVRAEQERQSAEAALRESEARRLVAAAVETERRRLFAVLETLPAMICLLTPEYQVAFANRSFRDKFGEAGGRHCYECCFGRAQPCEFCESYQVLRTGQPHHWEVNAPGGSVLEAHDYPFTDVDGTPMILEMDLDITERRRAETALAESQTRLSAIFDHSKDGILVAKAGRFVMVNPALLQMYRCESAAEVVGHLLTERVAPSDADRVAHNIGRRETGEGAPALYEVMILRRDGTTFPAEIQASTYILDGEQYSIGVVRDITERVRSEQERERAEAAIRRLNQDLEKALAEEKAVREQLIQAEKLSALGRLVGSVAHEFNNPLQTVANSLYLVDQDLAPESPVHDYLEMAQQETQRLVNLAGQLRELYRIRATGQREALGLGKLLREVRTLMASPLQAGQVEWRQPAEAPDYRALIIPDRLKQVFINLTTNAIEAMSPGGGTLDVDLALSPDGQSVGVRFRDTGPGIDPENLNHLFEPFFTTKTQGLGLGLSICYEIVQQHGGEITVDSQPGHGAQFTVWLPLVARDNA